MRLFTYEYKGLMGSRVTITQPQAFKTPRGAENSAQSFRKKMGGDRKHDYAMEIRVVELVKQGTGRVVSEYTEASIGKWH